MTIDAQATITNLTQAIADNLPIDYRALEARQAVFLNSIGEILDIGALRHEVGEPWAFWYGWTADSERVHRTVVPWQTVKACWEGKLGCSLHVPHGVPLLPRADNDDTAHKLAIYEQRMAYIAESYPFIYADALERVPDTYRGD